MMFLAALLILACAAALSGGYERGWVDRGATAPAGLKGGPVVIHPDVPYAGTSNPRQRLDLYLPKNRADGKLPVIVFFHGGGWSMGDKSEGAENLVPLVRSGRYAGVSAGYRLSLEAKWPAQIHDCKAVIRWVRANAVRYGFDADRIGVWGSSAGAHLALMLGLSTGVPELEGRVGPYTGESSHVTAVVNFFGVTQLLAMLERSSGYDPTRSDDPAAVLLGGPVIKNIDKARSASPISYVDANDPPVMTVHGTKDRTVPYDQAVRLHAALAKAGVPNYLIKVVGGDHEDFGAAVDERVRGFLDRYLQGENVPVSTRPVYKP